MKETAQPLPPTSSENTHPSFFLDGLQGNLFGNLTVLEMQQRVDQWIKKYGVRYFSELTNMACLTEEVGELARVIARTYGDQSFKKGEKQNLSEELADVLWILVCLANQTGVNLTDAFEASMLKKTNRDNTRHLENNKLKTNK